jgi:hypothetical protein
MSEKDDDQRRSDPRDSTALSAADNSFAGFVDSYEGEDEDEAVSQRMILGTRIKFANDAKWTNAQGDELDPQLHLIVVEMKRVVNKWPVNLGPPIDTMEVAPGRPWPNIKQLNDACPQSEWRTDFNGNPKGPYEPQRLLYLLDPVTLDKYTYPTNTIGGTRALSELADKIAWAQKYRGPGVRPLVHLSSIWMPTKYSGRMRPHFVVLPDWILPDGGSGALVHKPSPQISGPAGATAASPSMTAAAKLDVVAGNASAPPPAAKPTKPAMPSQEMLAKAGLQTVREPSLAEEMKDEIKF